MTKKLKRNKKRKRPKIFHEIVGIFLIGTGMFFFLSLYTSDLTGAIGPVIRKHSLGLFGIISFILPLVICTFGVFAIISYHKKTNKTKLTLSISFTVLLICLIHLFWFNHYDKTNFLSFISSSYENGIGLKGTGALLAPIVYSLYILIGLAGTYLFLIVLLLILLIVLLNLSIKDMGSYIYNNFKLKDANTKNEYKKDNTSDKKDFVGELVDFDTEYSDDNDVSLLKDDFISHPSQRIISMDENITIIDYVSQNNTNNEMTNTKKTINSSINDSDVDKEVNTKSVEINKVAIPYNTPPLSLLKQPSSKKGGASLEKNVLENAKLLEDTLNSFGVTAKVIQVSRGPAITRYELQPAPGIKVSKIVNLTDDIALNLAASGVRIEAPIPGKAAIGVEIPNSDIAPVMLREVIESDSFKYNKSTLSFALGKDIAGKNIIADIGKMPHLLIAGATGSGKSVCINTLIVSILYKTTPEEVKLIMIDPKVVELNNYNGIPHLMVPVVTDPKKAAGVLNWTVQEMVSRYKLFADKGVRDIDRYNEAINVEAENKLPKIIVIIDELADLMMVAPGDVEDAICRLAQMARAAGIHLVIATQRPSVDVITGVIKANIPSRIAFSVSSQVDSRTILDMAGAEKLLGRGDMLFHPIGSNKPIRVQGAFITEKEVEDIVSFIKEQNNTPEYKMEVLDEIAAEQDFDSADMGDELLPEAIEIVIDAGQASISMLQRRLRIGYARAARLIDEMEVRGIVSGFDGSKPRNILISKEDFEQLYKE